MTLKGAHRIQDSQFTILSIGFDITRMRRGQRAIDLPGYAIVEANDVAALFSHLASEQFELLLIGGAVSQLDREWLIRTVRRQYPPLPIVFVASRTRGTKKAMEPGCFCVTDPYQYLARVDDRLKTEANRTTAYNDSEQP